MNDKANLAAKRAALSPEKRRLLAQRLKGVKNKTTTAAPGLISKAAQRQSFPLSLSQQRVWFFQQVNPQSSAYNENLSTLIDHMTVAHIQQALMILLERHTILRSIFPLSAGKPIQQQLAATAVNVQVIRLTEQGYDSRLAAAKVLADNAANCVFDLQNQAAFNALIIPIDAQTVQLTVVNHHLISDEWSRTIFYRELSTLLEALSQGKTADLPELEIEYGDYALWQQQLIQTPDYQPKLQYWLDLLKDGPELTTLPIDLPRSDNPSFRGKKLHFTVPASLHQPLQQLVNEEKATVFMGLLTLVNVLLHRYSGDKDIVIGAPMANRDNPQLQHCMGFFVNILLYRSDLSQTSSFRQLLSQLRQQATASFARREVPFDQIVEKLNPDRQMSYSPIFQVLFSYQDLSSSYVAGMDESRVFQRDNHTARYDLSFAFSPQKQDLGGIIEYNADLFNPDTIERMRDHLIELLKLCAQQPDKDVTLLPMLLAHEREQLLLSWNDTSSAFDHDSTVAQLFEQQVQRSANQVALRYCDSLAENEEKSLTYAELNSQANGLARQLRAQGIQRGDIVAIRLSRSKNLIVAMLAVLKAGATYVPMDPDYPEARQQLVLRDAAPCLVICDSELAVDVASINLNQLSESELTAQSDQNLDAPSHGDDLAYIIYTSGSTGTPKGVKVSHRNVANFFTGISQRIDFTADAKLLAVTGYAFDIALLELLWTLCNGLEVVLSERRFDRGDGQLTKPAVANTAAQKHKPLDFSLFFFSSVANDQADGKYQLLLDSAKYADEQGFCAIWTPERHFHEFGGLFPNPIVTSAAMASVTKNIHIRAGSVVLPLHHEMLVAEDWAMVDNLSNGRVGVSFATGWNPQDFVLAPDKFASRYSEFSQSIATIRRLWSGEHIDTTSVKGEALSLRIYPRPVQANIPIWVTAAGHPDTFELAGKLGANLLTHLISQSKDQLQEKISLYRQAWRDAGHPGNGGQVTLMLHTYVGCDDENVKETVRAPFKNYLISSSGLVKAANANSTTGPLSAAQEDVIINNAFERYYQHSSLIGTAVECLTILDSISAIDVDEVACLVDFGIDQDTVFAGLQRLNEVKNQSANAFAQLPIRAAEKSLPAGRNVVAEISDYAISHLQCTPTFIKMLLTLPGAEAAIGQLKVLMLGGEPLSNTLLQQLTATTTARIYNMYGPTETTVWSSIACVSDKGDKPLTIGRPIANTQMYILDQHQQPVPIGVEGDLYIGGEGVSQGYHHKTALTEQRFMANPFLSPFGQGTADASHQRIYHTGDRAKYCADGNILLLGRNDEQVKIRGHRVELSDIEATLATFAALENVVTRVWSSDGDQKLVAYYVAEPEANLDIEQLTAFATAQLPAHMVPNLWVPVDVIPQTANGKTDRLALANIEITPLLTSETFEAPLAGAEARLAALWSRLLVVEKVSRNDDFFRLGGHSLLAVSLLDQIEKSFAVAYPISQLLSHSQLKDMAASIAALAASNPAVSRLPELVLTIDSDNASEPFELTDIQQAYWIGRQAEFEMGNVACHFYQELDLNADFDIDKLQQAWHLTVQRHGMLRAVVSADGMQRCLPEVPLYRFKRHDLSALSSADETQQLAQLRANLSHQVITTDQYPLYDISYSVKSDGKTRIHFSIDTIIADGESVRIMMKDWLKFYFDNQALAPLQATFRDYVQTLKQHNNSEHNAASLAYFIAKLTKTANPPALPLACQPQEIKNPRFVRHEHLMSKTQWAGLSDKIRHHGLTPSSLILSIYHQIIGRWSQNTDFPVMLTLFNRRPLHQQMPEVVGDFTSLSMFSLTVDNQLSVLERGRQYQQELWENLEHQGVSSIQVAREQQKLLAATDGHHAEAVMSSPIVFTSELGNQQGDKGDSNSEDKGFSAEDELMLSSKIDSVYIITQTPQVWIDHQVSDRGGVLNLSWDVVADLFPPNMIEQMFSIYCQMLDYLASDQSDWQQPLPWTLPQQQVARRAQINSDHQPLPQALLHQSFYSQLQQTPDHPAVISTERTLSYAQLAQHVGVLAQALKNHQMQAGDRVAVHLDKGWQQIVSVLAVLQLGGVYVPLEQDLPVERVNTILADAEVAYLLTQIGTADESVDVESGWPEAVSCLVVDVILSHADATGSIDELIRAGLADNGRTPTDAAYIIYTSGSTGQPKGVEINHQSALNTLVDVNSRFELNSADRVFAISALSFDLSVWDIFGTLAAGATIVMPDHHKTREPSHWLQLIKAFDVTVWNSVPALLDILITYSELEQDPSVLASLRLAMLSGDWIPLGLAPRAWQSCPKIKLVSMGGATEAAIWSIVYPINDIDPAWRSIPYGKPMKNQQFLVLNGQLQECPDWVPGDLYIGGEGLAMGYVNNPQKTQSSFIIHPQTQQRLYRTGDLGRFVADGNIEFLGRQDQQVKLNGFRVELGEIEKTLVACAGVEKALVMVEQKAAGAKQLIAHLVGSPEDAVVIPDGSIGLESQVLDSRIQHDYHQRRSFRYFNAEAVSMAQLGLLLAPLRAMLLDGEQKYLYPSASSLYPIHAYVYLKAQNEQPNDGGLYRYDRKRHWLTKLAPAGFVDKSLYSETNQAMFESAAGALFLVCHAEQMIAKYADLAPSLSLLEAGYMGQAIMQSAGQTAIGVCPVGWMDFAKIASHFALEPDDQLVHSFLLGQVNKSSHDEVNLQAALESKDNRNAVIEQFLANRLPAYMLPSQLVFHQQFPINSNGKVDRKVLSASQSQSAPQSAPALPLSQPESQNSQVNSHANSDYVAPRNQLEQQLCEIYAAVLGLEQVGISDNFFHLGGDSLLVLKVIAHIKRDLGLTYAIKQFYAAPSIAQLVTEVTSDPVTEVVNLLNEAKLDPAVHANAPIYPPDASQDILLTGATGFVGRYLLAELLSHTRVNIHCLVRATTLDEGLVRIKTSMQQYGVWQDQYQGRIMPVLGDLAQPQLGIEAELYQQLSTSIAAVYHCATYMDHLATYRQMKAANVDGVNQVLKFVCHQRQKRLDYVSTVEIFNRTPGRQVDEQTPIERQVHHHKDGYSATKWVAEKILMLANEKGVGANIYRLGLVTGDETSGKNDPSQWFSKLMVSCHNSGCCFEETQMPLAMTPVDFVARAIRVLAQQSSGGDIYHLNHPEPIEFVDMVKAYNEGNSDEGNAEKQSIELLKFTDYIRRLKHCIAQGIAIPIEYQFSDHLQMSDDELNSLEQKNSLEPENSPAAYALNGHHTSDRLAQQGLQYPHLNQQWLSKYLRVSVGAK